MILQLDEWQNLRTTALICLIILIIYKCLQYTRIVARKHAMFRPSSVPRLSVLRYFSVLISVYKQSTPNCPALALGLQWVWCLCLLYGQKGLLGGTVLYKPGMMFYKPETVEVLLNNTELIEKGILYKLIAPWLGAGLITSGGEKWRKHRKMLTPTFHFSILENFIPVFQEQSEILVSKLQLRIQEPWIDALPLISACTLDALCQTAMGISINAQNDENCEYCKAIHEIGESFMYRAPRPWLYPDIIFNLTSHGRKFNTNIQIVHGVTFGISSERSDIYRKKDIREEVDTFMFAGHDTTAATISWTLYCLGVHQEIQKKVHEELDMIFKMEENNSISRETLTRMKYLECVIKWLWGLCLLYGTKGVMRGTLLFKQAIVFYKPETVQVLLSDKDLIEKSSEYKLMVPWLGTGLVTSGGEKWRKHRKLLTPTFHFSILENFIPVFQEQSEILVSKLQLRIQEPWIDALPLISTCTLDAVCQSAMGISINAQNDENLEYCKAIHEITDSYVLPDERPWLSGHIFNFTSQGESVNGNSKSEKEMEGSYFQNRKPFLELLLEYHLKDPTFTENDIREEVDTFMFAGYDTMAVTINWTLYCLGVYQEIQKKVHEELDKIFKMEENNSISRETLTRMKYLECVIKETMRLYPTVPVILRENKQSFKVLGYNVYTGTTCCIFISALHRDPVSFPNPEIFDPDRFLPENSKNRHPYAYVAFSAGPRNCIGQKFAMMEMKIILSSILRRFRVSSLDGREKVIIYPNLVIRSVKPLRLKFESR
ncbi:Cytochrome P450 4V2 like protein [Argiope bruennichi]|uniref:Cytochrome P450 4V2 like protein n=1 Tax=Argiope bruennichi TaxID=94029 RepID=A0A8T0ED02_ARGBR|nr:Cytochrome P450 4V2 like protein [Argiope bruennichi]